jgi:hypothetical protein
VARRRILCVMRRFAASALVAGLALTGAACGASMRKAAGRALTRQQLVSLTVPGVHAGPGPFVPTGTLEGGSTSGHWGDGSSARTGTVLGCLSRRHYSFAITVRNRSRRVVTLTGARGPDPLPRVLDRVAMQVRHAPPPPAGEGLQRPLIQRWSAAPARPVRIRPGRSAVVQSNFLMRHCDSLPLHRRVTVPGSFVLSYRVPAGPAGHQNVVQRNAGFSLVPGPIIRSCSPVPGSISLMSGNIGCTLARKAATACHHMSHGTWGNCLAGGRRWGCHLHSSRVQECTFIYRTSRWYRVRWAK